MDIRYIANKLDNIKEMINSRSIQAKNQEEIESLSFLLVSITDKKIRSVILPKLSSQDPRTPSGSLPWVAEI